MRLVIVGDKSRYHFFRSIADMSQINNQESFFTERLGEREVFLTSDLKKIDDNFFYSPLVPLNTDLYFPPEPLDVLSVINNGDRIVLLDEFPYATDFEIDIAKKVLESGNSLNFAVVLFQRCRESLETDISNDDMAVEEAEFRYSQFKIPIYRFVPGSFPRFLLWENNIDFSPGERIFCSKIKMIELELGAFDSTYEVMLEVPYEHGNNISMLIGPDVLAEFCNYSRKLNKRNVWDVYHEKACKFYSDNNYAVKDFCKDIYKETVESVCVWNFEKDFERLYESAVEEFRKIIDELDSLVYEGGEGDYDIFLNENEKEIITYKTKIQDFFKVTLKELIKSRAIRNKEKLEALYI